MADPFTFFALLQKSEPFPQFSIVPLPSQIQPVRPSAMCQKCHIITRYEPDADGDAVWLGMKK